VNIALGGLNVAVSGCSIFTATQLEETQKNLIEAKNILERFETYNQDQYKIFTEIRCQEKLTTEDLKRLSVLHSDIPNITKLTDLKLSFRSILTQKQ